MYFRYSLLEMKTESKFRPASSEERKALRIPPAWTGVEVADSSDSKVQARGRDGKGRLQCIYSAAHTAAALRGKFSRLVKFNAKLPTILKRVQKDLAGPDAEEAAVLRLVYFSGFRNGGDSGNGKVKAYGASNLLAEHVTVEGDVVTFDFIGKLGVRQQHEIRDAGLAADLAARKARGGNLFDTDSAKVLRYLKKSGNFKVHDFRTWNATELALTATQTLPSPKTAEEFWAARDMIGDLVAKKLGDTRKIVLDCYINPSVFAAWKNKLNINEKETRPKVKKTKAATFDGGSDAENGQVFAAFAARQNRLQAA